MGDDGHTVVIPEIEQGGGGLTVTANEQVLLVVYGPLVTVRITVTV